MADQSAQAKPAIKTIQAFAREIAQMSGQALVRASIQADFLKESMEHAAKYIEMLATFPHELVETAEQPATPPRRSSGAFPKSPIKLKVTAARALDLSGAAVLFRPRYGRNGTASRNRGQRILPASPKLM